MTSTHAGFYVDSVLYARDFAAAMSAEAAVAYLVPVLASCGYRYIHKSTTFGTEENTAPQRVCNCLSYKKQWFSIKIYYRDCRVVAILCVALI